MSRQCLVCTAPMKEVKYKMVELDDETSKLAKKEKLFFGKKFRERNYECTICDFKERIRADGGRDDMQGEFAQYYVEKMFKQEEDARR